jgi:hypothetical protein
MKTKLFLISALAGLTAATGAVAQQAPTGVVNVTGTVAARCVFASPDAVTLAIGEMSVTTGATADLGKLAPTALTSRTANLNGFCNGVAASIGVEGLALVNTDFTSAAPTGFDRRVDFTTQATVATAALGSVSASDTTTTAGAGANTVAGLFSNDVVVSFSDAATPTGGRLIAGPYAGSVIVTLRPAG